jgi:hypothetical protein
MPNDVGNMRCLILPQPTEPPVESDHRMDSVFTVIPFIVTATVYVTCKGDVSASKDVIRNSV